MQKLCQPFLIVARETSLSLLQCYWIVILPNVGMIVVYISSKSQSIVWYDACYKLESCHTYPISIRSLAGMLFAISNKQAKG